MSVGKVDVTMSVVVLTQQNFEQEVLKSDKPVLVDFWADWCGPCRMVSPIVDEIADERKDILVGTELKTLETCSLNCKLQNCTYHILVNISC